MAVLAASLAAPPALAGITQVHTPGADVLIVENGPYTVTFDCAKGSLLTIGTPQDQFARRSTNYLRIEWRVGDEKGAMKMDAMGPDHEQLVALSGGKKFARAVVETGSETAYFTGIDGMDPAVGFDLRGVSAEWQGCVAASP
jgi:hypothetical protein